MTYKDKSIKYSADHKGQVFADELRKPKLKALKNHPAAGLVILILILTGLACEDGYFSQHTDTYDCEVKGENRPETGYQFIKRGKKHLEKNESECAVKACSTAISLDKKNGDAYSCRASAYYHRAEYNLALEDWTEAIRLGPKYPSYYHNRGLIYRIKKEYEKAIKELTTCIRLRRKGAFWLPWDYYIRGDTYFEMGDYENAVKDYTEAIRLKPDSEHYYLSRADAYRKLGKTKLAKADISKAKQLKAEESEAKEAPADESTSPGKNQNFAGGSERRLPDDLSDF